MASKLSVSKPSPPLLLQCLYSIAPGRLTKGASGTEVIFSTSLGVAAYAKGRRKIKAIIKGAKVSTSTAPDLGSDAVRIVTTSPTAKSATLCEFVQSTDTGSLAVGWQGADQANDCKQAAAVAKLFAK